MALLVEGEKVTTTAFPLPKRFRVHAAFSYSSADADYVRQVGEALPPEIKVHDYKTDEAIALTAGYDLKKTLKHIYKYEALFVFAFISKAYEQSEYTQIEWDVASSVAKRKPGYVIPVRMEETQMKPSGTWLDGTLPAERLASLIANTVRRPPPKPWWFYLSFEVKAAIVVAFVALILAIIFSLPSRTSLQSAHANEDGITAHLVNIRTKSATVVGQRLKFGALPIEDVELRLAKGESATIAPGVRDLKLKAAEIITKCNSAEGLLWDKKQIEALLDQQPVTLEIDIRESDDAPKKSRRQNVTFPAARIKSFVIEGVSGDAATCD
jgi:hypothetical protein